MSQENYFKSVLKSGGKKTLWAQFSWNKGLTVHNTQLSNSTQSRNLESWLLVAAFVIKCCNDSCRNGTHPSLFPPPSIGIQYVAADRLLGGTPLWIPCECVHAYVDPDGLSFILQIALDTSTSIMRHRCRVTSCLAWPPLVSVLQPACAVQGVLSG